MRCVLLSLLSLLLATVACTSPLSEPSPTATPVRPIAREALYTAEAGDGVLTVTLEEAILTQPGLSPDTQWIAVLADGNGSPSYLVYPANQPGIGEPQLNLTDYPLQIETQADAAHLWVLAVRHHAYPILEKIGIESIGQQLADAYDQVQGDTTDGQTVAQVIAAQTSDDLLMWFGQTQVLGELTLPLQVEQVFTEVSNTAASPDENISINYSVAYDPVQAIIAPPATETAQVSSDAGQLSYEGYKLVIDEDFANAESDVDWFRGRDDSTYFATIVEGAYRIGLVGVEPFRENPLSWGSIQELVFDDYIVRAEMRVIERNLLVRYGLWLHYQDDWNFVFFGIENTGRYRVARFQRTYTELQNWTTDSSIAIGTESNVMEIHLNGDQYTLFINGKELTTVSDSAFDKGRIAFFCYAEAYPATCDLQNIKVWIPEDEQFPPATPTPTTAP